MEMILGIIEDLIDRFKNGTSEEKEDAKASLIANKNQFINNLNELINKGNSEAKKLLDELNILELN